jgi:hypothetical protein
MNRKSIILLIAGLLIALISFLTYPRIKRFFKIDSCLDSGGRWNYKTGQCEFAEKDSSSLKGYNELANEQQRNLFTISEYNTDLKEIENILRPEKSEILNPSFDTSLLFGIWAQDTTGPHADFWLKSSEFYVVDYDGNGSMPYIIKKDSLTVYYNDFKMTGQIIQVGLDSMTISWNETDRPTTYYKWKN